MRGVEAEGLWAEILLLGWVAVGSWVEVLLG